MSIDLTKLTPAPWASVGPCEANPVMPFALAVGMDVIAWFKSEADCDQAALARNAFDVMMRRRWGILAVADGWTVDFSGAVCDSQQWGKVPKNIWFGRRDPFTAIVETDKWYRENVEAKESAMT